MNIFHTQEADMTLRSTAKVELSQYDRRMLAIADDLFVEFDHLPIRSVLRAICVCRGKLRDQGVLHPPPDEVYRLAHASLLDRQHLVGAQGSALGRSNARAQLLSARD